MENFLEEIQKEGYDKMKTKELETADKIENIINKKNEELEKIYPNGKSKNQGLSKDQEKKVKKIKANAKQEIDNAIKEYQKVLKEHNFSKEKVDYVGKHFGGFGRMLNKSLRNEGDITKLLYPEDHRDPAVGIDKDNYLKMMESMYSLTSNKDPWDSQKSIDTFKESVIKEFNHNEDTKKCYNNNEDFRHIVDTLFKISGDSLIGLRFFTEEKKDFFGVLYNKELSKENFLAQMEQEIIATNERINPNNTKPALQGATANYLRYSLMCIFNTLKIDGFPRNKLCEEYLTAQGVEVNPKKCIIGYRNEEKVNATHDNIFNNITNGTKTIPNSQIQNNDNSNSDLLKIMLGIVGGGLFGFCCYLLYRKYKRHYHERQNQHLQLHNEQVGVISSAYQAPPINQQDQNQEQQETDFAGFNDALAEEEQKTNPFVAQKKEGVVQNMGYLYPNEFQVLNQGGQNQGVNKGAEKQEKIDNLKKKPDAERQKEIDDFKQNASDSKLQQLHNQGEISTETVINIYQNR